MENYDNIPTSWDQITIGQFIELNSINLEEFESEFYLMLEKLAIITNTSADDEQWEEMDVMEVMELIKTRRFLNFNPPNKFKNNIDDLFISLPFNDLTLGEFIDLEYYFSENIIENFTNILCVLYRKFKKGEWGEQIIEPYSLIEKSDRKIEFEDIKITDVFGIIDAFIKWKNNFMDKYEALFQPDIEDEYNEEDIKNDPQLAHEIEQEKKEEAKHKKWGWIKLTHYLADGDIIKMKEILNLRLVYVFNLLGMKKELGITN